MSNHLWQTVSEGDVVDIIAPSSGSSALECKKAVDFIKKNGLIPRLPEDIHGKEFFLANSDEYRLKHIKNVFTNTDSKLLWCLRGGYGSARLIPELMKLNKPENYKLLIGFSDITALHIMINQIWGWHSLHAPVLVQLGFNKVANDAVIKLKNLLFGVDNEIKITDLEAINNSAKKLKKIEADMVGGNLSIIQTSLGTNWQIKTKDKILFIEEIGERGYKLDRILNHLKQAEIFDKASAIMIGDIIGEKEKDGSIITDQVINDFFNNIDVPVFKCSGIGHDFDNNPLPLGINYTLENKNDKTILSCRLGI